MKKDILKDEDWSPQKVAEYSFFKNEYATTIRNAQKTMLSIAIGGIGLLVALSNFLSFSSVWQIVFFLFSLISLMLLVISILGMWGMDAKICDINADLIIVEKSEEKNKLKKQLKFHKKFYIECRLKAKCFWLLAFLFIALFVITTICINYNPKKENPIKIQKVQVIGPVQTYPVLKKTK